MSNEIVKFSNQFNNQALRRFTALDLDVLMAISTKVRDKGTDKVTFTFDELRKLARLKSKRLTDEEMAKEVIQVNSRLLALNFQFVEEDRTVIQFALFRTFKTSPVTATLTVSVNEEFSFLLNDLTSSFTRFELAEFADLKSSYAKEFYRRAKQYRATGIWTVSLEDFMRFLDVPKSYRSSDLNTRVLQPIMEELGPLMHLRIERRYAKKHSGRGRPSLVGFTFHFDRERPNGEHVATPVQVLDAVPHMGEEERRALERERQRHGGSMFVGSDSYVDEPLFD